MTEQQFISVTSSTLQALKNHEASHTQTIQKSPLSRSVVECDICFKTLKNVKDLQQHKQDFHSSAITAKKTKTPPVNLKQQLDIVEIKDTMDEGVFRCHICKAFSNNLVDVRNHICREHPKFVFICSEVTCVKAYVIRSGLNKHKQKHSDHAGNSFTVCCLFCEEGFKTEELCDKHMCAGMLEHKKQTENQDKNGSVKPCGKDVAGVEEEP